MISRSVSRWVLWAGAFAVAMFAAGHALGQAVGGGAGIQGGGGSGGGGGTVGPGTINRVAKFTAANTVGDSAITESSTATAIGYNGSAASPALTFGAVADPNTGFYHPAADSLAFSLNGTQQFVADPNGGFPTDSFYGSFVEVKAIDSTGLAGSAANFRAKAGGFGATDSQQGFVAEYDGTHLIQISVYGPARAGNFGGTGIANADLGIITTYTNNSGMILGTGNNSPLYLTTNTAAAAPRMTIFGGGAISMNLDGTAGAPELTFGATADLDTGIWHPAANTLAFSTGGTEAGRWNSSQNLVPPSDATGQIGENATRWNLVRAVTITSGDIGFDDDECVLCHKPLMIDGKPARLELYAYKQERPKEGKPFVLSVPVHHACMEALEPTEKVDRKHFWDGWFQ